MTIHSDVVGSRHLAVEIHSASQGAHLAVPSHELALSDEYRIRVLAEIVAVDIVIIAGRKNGLEHVLEVISFILLHLQTDSVILRY